MQPHEAARLVGISVNTVRAWTLYDYKQFFSPTAQGGSGRKRELTDTDVRVLTYLRDVKRDGLTGDEVIAALRQAQQRGFDMLPMPRNTEAIVPTPVIPVQAADNALMGERRALEILREETQARLDEYRELVEYERNRASQERQRYEESNKRALELERELGKLEGRLQALEQQLGVNGVADSNVT